MNSTFTVTLTQLFSALLIFALGYATFLGLIVACFVVGSFIYRAMSKARALGARFIVRDTVQDARTLSHLVNPGQISGAPLRIPAIGGFEAEISDSQHTPTHSMLAP